MSARPNAGSAITGKQWVAVEGPCCAGKTTLSRGLLERDDRASRSRHVHCYADHVGGGRFLPRPVPESVPEDQAAIRALLQIEAERVAGVGGTARFHPVGMRTTDPSLPILRTAVSHARSRTESWRRPATTGELP